MTKSGIVRATGEVTRWKNALGRGWGGDERVSIASLPLWPDWGLPSAPVNRTHALDCPTSVALASEGASRRQGATGGGTNNRRRGPASGWRGAPGRRGGGGRVGGVA